MSVITLADKNPLSSIIANCTEENIVYLPVAPQVVGRSRFAPLMPTSAPTTTVPEAIAILQRAMEDSSQSITMVAISGPGDPLATPEITLNTITQIKKLYPKLKVGLKTYGIGSEKLASQLADAGLDYVEIQVDAMRSEMLERGWVTFGGHF